MVMTPFAPGWWAFLAFIAVVTVGLHSLLRHRSASTVRYALTGMAIATVGFSTWFTFDRILNPTIYFPLTQNLPLHFCTIVSFLLVPAAWLRPRSDRGTRAMRQLYALLFYPGAAAAFLALVSPALEYTGRPYFSMNTLFYLVHSLNVMVPVLFVSLGLYKPRRRDITFSMISFTALALLIVLPITIGLRAWVDPAANYYYFFDPQGADFLVMLWNLIPVPVLYQVPLLVLIMPVLWGQYGLYRLIARPSAVGNRLRGLGSRWTAGHLAR